MDHEPAYPTIGHALIAWAGTGRKQDALIEIHDSGRYQLTDLINLGGRSVELRARNGQRPVIALPASGCPVDVGEDATFLFSGLLMEGGPLRVRSGEGSTFELRHCTLVPGHGLTPDGSPIAAAPVLAGNTVVIVTRNGGVFGYRPE